MTFEEAYTSLKQLYKKLMFSDKGWTMAEIDATDFRFLEEVMDSEEQEQVVYIDQIM